MQGLILKDILNLKGYIKTLFFTLLICTSYGIFLENGLFVGIMITLLMSQQVMTTMSYDDLAKWDKFALTMNIDRADIVKSKFVFFIGSVVISYLVGFILSIGINQTLEAPMSMMEVVLPFSIIVVVYTIVFCIVMPLLFKKGVEKARIIMISLYFIPAILVFLAFKLFPNISIDFEMLAMMLENNLILILLAGLILTAISLMISYKVSLSVYLKKEF